MFLDLCGEEEWFYDFMVYYGKIIIEEVLIIFFFYFIDKKFEV